MISGVRPGDVGFAREPKGHHGKLHSHIPISIFGSEVIRALTLNLQAFSQSMKTGGSQRIRTRQLIQIRLMRSSIDASFRRLRGRNLLP